jgi:hypothetical protein
VDSIWWKQVTNAVRYVNEVKDKLLNEKSVLLVYTNGMPWRNSFVEIIIEAVKSQNADKKFVSILTDEEPGKYLLNEFCKPEKRSEYRPSIGYARFLAKNDDIVIHDRYLWVQIKDANGLEKWTEFVSNYLVEREGKGKKAVFILELCEGKKLSKIKGINALTFDNYIGEYDRIVFAVLASSGIKEPSFIKNYTAELLANVIGNDIELCAECVQGYRAFLTSPLTFIQGVVAEKYRSDHSEFVYEKDESEVEHLIWLSQIKTVYPYLEEYREDFVQRYASDIKKQLPINAPYGETFTDPKDVELGTLTYMAGMGYISLSTDEYEKLRLFKEARNKLSHLTALSIDEVRRLL